MESDKFLVQTFGPKRAKKVVLFKSGSYVFERDSAAHLSSQ